VIFCDCRAALFQKRVFGAHLPGTKIIVIESAAPWVSILLHHTKPKYIHVFIFSLKMYAQTAGVVKLLNFEIIYTRKENICI
jgi:uncharacterized membrane protein